MTTQIPVPYDDIAAFCRKWKIKELALFGSVLHDDFRSDSDIDVLITREPGVYWPWGGYAEMTEELELIFGRRVDLHERPALEQSRNYIIRKNVLGSAQVVYAA